MDVQELLIPVVRTLPTVRVIGCQFPSGGQEKIVNGEDLLATNAHMGSVDSDLHTIFARRRGALAARALA
jgi:hypothetical protein